MDGRTRRDAVERCLADARRAIGCVTNQPLRVIGANQTAELPASISFVPLSTTVSLRTTTGSRLGFAFRLDVSTVAEPDSYVYRVVPVSYGYRLSDRSGHELLAYHWHPDGLSPIVHPHLHISSRVRSVPLEPDGGSLDLSDHHMPTGHVTLSDIVRFLIAEVGVEPRRADWMDVLAAVAV